MVTELKTTTSAAALASGGTITPIVTPPTHADAMAQAKRAFEDDAHREKLAGSGVQRMVYAVMVECVRGMADGTLPFRLADAFTAGNERKTIQARLSAMFAGDKPDTKAIGEAQGGEAATAASKLWGKRNALVSRGVEGAAILATHGVPFTAFNASTGIWAVFPAMLHPRKAVPGGRLATDAAIALDGRPIVWMGQAQNGKDLPGGAIASYAQMLSVCKAPVVPRAPKQGAGLTPTSGEGVTFNPNNGESVATTCPLAAIIDALYILMVKDAPKELPSRDSLSLDSWSRLSAVMERYQAARDAPTWVPAPTMPAKAKRKAS